MRLVRRTCDHLPCTLFTAPLRVLRQYLPVVAACTACLVALQLRHAAVEPRAAATLAAIRSLRPYAVSWSNVPDYIAPREFHAMARACSTEVSGELVARERRRVVLAGAPGALLCLLLE